MSNDEAPKKPSVTLTDGVPTLRRPDGGRPEEGRPEEAGTEGGDAGAQPAAAPLSDEVKTAPRTKSGSDAPPAPEEEAKPSGERPTLEKAPGKTAVPSGGPVAGSPVGRTLPSKDEPPGQGSQVPAGARPVTVVEAAGVEPTRAGRDAVPTQRRARTEEPARGVPWALVAAVLIVTGVGVFYWVRLGNDGETSAEKDREEGASERTSSRGSTGSGAPTAGATAPTTAPPLDTSPTATTTIGTGTAPGPKPTVTATSSASAGPSAGVPVPPWLATALPSGIPTAIPSVIPTSLPPGWVPSAVPWPTAPAPSAKPAPTSAPAPAPSST